MTEMQIWKIVIFGGLVVGVLNIILFFKIWGMTNNTKKIVLFLEATRPDLEYDNGKGDFLHIPASYRERSQEKND